MPPHENGAPRGAPFSIGAVSAWRLCLLGAERFVGFEDAAGYFLEKQTVLFTVGHAGHYRQDEGVAVDADDARIAHAVVIRNPSRSTTLPCLSRVRSCLGERRG